MRFRPSGGLGHGTAATAARPRRHRRRARKPSAARRRPEKVYRAPATRTKSSAPRTSPPACRRKGCPGNRRRPEPRQRAISASRTCETPAAGRRKRSPSSRSPVKEQPRGIVESIRAAATNLVKKVQRLIKPVKRIHKEVIINAETLETRVAVSEEGRLEEFTIERTTEERLVGSIFKGKVRNLEDGLKAAFVDIGFEKNAFLHYWDIVPNSFDSGVEIVERGGRRREKPKITQKDIPRLYPPGSEIIVQVTKGPIGTKGPRVTTNLVLPGRYLVLLPNSDQSGISRKIENQQERQRLKKILRELTIPDGMGVIMRTVGEGQQKRYFVRDLALLLEEWNQIQERIKTQPPATCVFQEPDLIERTVRDFLTEDVERIVVDSPKAYDRMREMISKISKRSADKVKLYTRPAADLRPLQHHPAVGERLLPPGPSQERRLHRRG